MTWPVGADQMVSVNVTVLALLMIGCLLGVAGGFLALFSWLERRLRFDSL